MQELKEEMKGKQKQTEKNKNNENPSFGMNLGVLKQFMFDPVKNTMIIDGGITTSRLVESRNPQDFVGYVIKEGGFWGSMYFLGPWIQKKLEEISAKKNKPIDLDIRVLQDETFQKAIKSGDIEKHLKAFDVKKSDVEVYDSLFKQGDNMLVQMMKKADIISTIKGGKKIDVTQFIDMDEIKGTAKTVGFKQKVENIYKRAKESGNIEAFFEKTIKLKQGSIIKNMSVSIGALGIIVPGLMVAMRYMDKDNKEFAVKKELKEKLMKNPEFMGNA